MRSYALSVMNEWMSGSGDEGWKKEGRGPGGDGREV